MATTTTTTTHVPPPVAHLVVSQRPAFADLRSTLVPAQDQTKFGNKGEADNAAARSKEAGKQNQTKLVLVVAPRRRRVWLLLELLLLVLVLVGGLHTP